MDTIETFCPENLKNLEIFFKKFIKWCKIINVPYDGLKKHFSSQISRSIQVQRHILLICSWVNWKDEKKKLYDLFSNINYPLQH